MGLGIRKLNSPARPTNSKQDKDTKYDSNFRFIQYRFLGN